LLVYALDRYAAADDAIPPPVDYRFILAALPLLPLSAAFSFVLAPLFQADIRHFLFVDLFSHYVIFRRHFQLSLATPDY